MLDRAGLVGQDGPTHHGVLDIAYLSSIPDVIVAAPRNGEELRHLMQTALKYDNGPFFIRYPKDSAEINRKSIKSKVLDIGKWEVLEDGPDTAIIAVGPMNKISDKAAEILSSEGIQAQRIDAKYIKPFDEQLLSEVLQQNKHVFIVEESNYPGSLSQTVQAFSAKLEGSAKVHAHTLPDRFVTHGSRSELLAEVKLTPEEVAAAIINNLNESSE